VPGRTAILISPEKQQLIGLRLSPVEKRELSRSIRTVATVEHDERRLARISPDGEMVASLISKSSLNDLIVFRSALINEPAPSCDNITTSPDFAAATG
jgi:hypothetical protein